MIFHFETGSEFWTSRDVRAAVQEALEASRRIEKNLNVAREVTRLAVALRSIEAAISTVAIPKIIDGAEAAEMIASLPTVGSIRLPFRLFEIAGHVSIGSFFSFVPFSVTHTANPDAESHRPSGGGHLPPSVPTQRAPGAESKLQSRIAAVKLGKEAVPLGNSRHIEITNALRAFLHASASRSAFVVNFIYKDGSVGAGVHLCELPLRPRPERTFDLNAAIESCRHFDLDARVDLYLLRNAEIERRADATLADQEAIAYSAFRAFLDELCGTEGLHLRLFHTGLEPAVVGVYRAVIDALISGSRLQVTPVFFPNGKDDESWW